MEDERERRMLSLAMMFPLPSRTNGLSHSHSPIRRERQQTEGRKEQKETDGFLPERAVPPPLPLPQSRRHRCLWYVRDCADHSIFRTFDRPTINGAKRRNLPRILPSFAPILIQFIKGGGENRCVAGVSSRITIKSIMDSSTGTNPTGPEYEGSSVSD